MANEKDKSDKSKSDRSATAPHTEVQPGDLDTAKPGGRGDLPVNMTPQPVSKTDADRANKLHDETVERQKKQSERAVEAVNKTGNLNLTLPGERPTKSRRDEAIKAGEPMDEALRPKPDDEQEAVFKQTGSIPPQLGGHESIAHREGVRPENVRGLDEDHVPEANKKGAKDRKVEPGVVRNPKTEEGKKVGSPEDPGV
jgi:hypothetical protein